MLPILHQDPHLVAVNKPHGLLVHPSPIAADAEEFAVQMLRDQLGQRVYPAHRIDRKTGGVLLFALSQECNALLQRMFMERQVAKKYLAIMRGHTEEAGEIDYPLKNDRDEVQDAQTSYRTLARAEIEVPLGKHPTSRYSLLELSPLTGRQHQLRKHLAHIFHPIIGDRPHGCNKQNKLWKERFGMNTMLLHAAELRFEHPLTKAVVCISAPPQEEFQRVMGLLFGSAHIPDDEAFL